jgi:hypothetical protein
MFNARASSRPRLFQSACAPLVRRVEGVSSACSLRQGPIFIEARASCWIRNPARFPSRDADRFAFCISHRELTFEIFK